MYIKIINLMKGAYFDMARQTKMDSNGRPEQKARVEKLRDSSEGQQGLQLTPPRHLDKISSRLWTQLVPQLNKSGLITEADKPTLEAFVMAYSMIRQSWESIKENGTTYMSDSGRIYKNPSADILSDQQTKLRMLGAELGLSPSARANLMDLSVADDSEDFDNLMSKLGINNGGDK